MNSRPICENETVEKGQSVQSISVDTAHQWAVDQIVIDK